MTWLSIFESLILILCVFGHGEQLVNSHVGESPSPSCPLLFRSSKLAFYFFTVKQSANPHWHRKDRSISQKAHDSRKLYTNLTRLHDLSHPVLF